MDGQEAQAPEQGNPLARKIAARTQNEITGIEGWIYRVRVLTPLEAVRLQGVMSMIAAAIDPEQTPEPGEGAEGAEGAEQPSAPAERLTAAEIAKKLDPAKLASVMEQFERIAVATVREARMSGGQWYPLRLVLRIEMQEPEAGKVFIGGVPPEDVAAIALSAMESFRRARKLARPFRRGPATE